VSKVTSKLQVTIPKAIAERFGISPGDEVEWEPAADAIRVVAVKAQRRRLDTEARLRLFDAATKRQRARELTAQPSPAEGGRGWTREELYDRGSTR
jgi:AbrB family looped-hinge helix DNA binding protein